jgi:peptidoglycan/xylan/chitin deacetylase (PgdA/CDA1 family)
MYLVKTPLLLKKLYPKKLIWNKPRTDKVIFLTFDDGPIPIVTPWVLKTLKSFDAKATFFCIGENITKHPEIFSQLIADGHAIGNHTFNHLNGWKTDDHTYLSNYHKCQEITNAKFFRPPFGRIKRAQIKELAAQEAQIIMWDVLSGDFDTKLLPEKCLSNVLKHSENGSIIVFHDSIKAWDRLEYALPKALAYWTKQGFKFKSL